MMGFDGNDMALWMWAVMGLVMVFVIGALIALIVLAVKTVSGTQPGNSRGALELLKRRFAAGEITQDEYEKTRRILEG